MTEENMYEFTVILQGMGNNINDAWVDATDIFSDYPGEPIHEKCIDGPEYERRAKLRGLMLQAMVEAADPDDIVAATVEVEERESSLDSEYVTSLMDRVKRGWTIMYSPEGVFSIAPLPGDEAERF